MPSEEMTIEEARELAAHCWCDGRISGTTFDPVLAEVFAGKLHKLCNRPRLTGQPTTDELEQWARGRKDVLVVSLPNGWTVAVDGFEPDARCFDGPDLRALLLAAKAHVDEQQTATGDKR